MLLIAAVVSLLVLFVLHSVLPQKRRWWHFALPVFLAALAFGLDLLVQTDFEKIKTVIKTATKAVEEEDPNTIDKLISNNYHDSYHKSKQHLMFFCRAKLSEPFVKKNITRIVSTEITATNATAIFTSRVVFDEQSFIAQNFKAIVLAKVKLELQKQQDKRWLISRVEILEIDKQPAKWRNVR